MVFSFNDLGERQKRFNHPTKNQNYQPRNYNQRLGTNNYHIAGPTGVRGRNSDNRLIREKLGWEPTMKLRDGLEKTYEWIESQVRKTKRASVAASVNK